MLAPSVGHYVFARDDGQPLDFIPGQFIQVHFAYADGAPAPALRVSDLRKTYDNGVQALKGVGARFVQMHAERNVDDGSYRLVYTFINVRAAQEHIEQDGSYAIENLVVEGIDQYQEIPSISSYYPAVFPFENEAHDLFGLAITDMQIDFKGFFYRVSIADPMSVIAPELKAAREKAMKVRAAAEAKARKAAQAERELADALAQAREELAQITGTATDADRQAAIERSYRDLRARLAAESDTDGVSLVDRLINVKAAQAALLKRCELNSLAAQGKYKAKMEK